LDPASYFLATSLSIDYNPPPIIMRAATTISTPDPKGGYPREKAEEQADGTEEFRCNSEDCKSEGNTHVRREHADGSG